MAAAAGGAAPAAAAAPAPFPAAPEAVAALQGLPFPPCPPLIGCEAGSFAQDTITQRLPAIMDTVLTDLKLQGEQAGTQEQQALAQQLEAAGAAVRQIQADMPADAPLLPLEIPAGLPPSHPLASIIPTTNAAVAAWQRHMAAGAAAGAQQGGSESSGSRSGGAASWLQLPWLVVECYLYVRLATIMASQPLLAAAAYDPFSRQKAAALTKSMSAAADIALALQQLIAQQQAATAAAAASGKDGATLQALFDAAAKERMYQLIQYALWGNKTDLSMLVDVAHIDPSTLGQDAASGSSNIIVDEFEPLWAYLRSGAAAGKGGRGMMTSSSSVGGMTSSPLPRVDIILDNAGLELYTDLVLADYVVTTGLAGTVVLHGKQLPWFVSDTLDHDLKHLLDTCAAAASSSTSGSSDGSDGAALAAMAAVAARWQQHLAEGRWVFRADPFWTTPHPFWWMEQLAPELHADLATSCLLVFKGDLNYRKLAGDCRWPPTTPFSTALCGFCPAPLVTLRTLKADVIAGLAPGEAEQLDKLDPRWQVNGRFGVVQFATTAAS